MPHLRQIKAIGKWSLVCNRYLRPLETIPWNKTNFSVRGCVFRFAEIFHFMEIQYAFCFYLPNGLDFFIKFCSYDPNFNKNTLRSLYLKFESWSMILSTWLFLKMYSGLQIIRCSFTTSMTSKCQVHSWFKGWCF